MKLTFAAAAALAFISAPPAQAQFALNDILDGGVAQGRRHGRLEPDERARPGDEQLQEL